MADERLDDHYEKIYGMAYGIQSIATVLTFDVDEENLNNCIKGGLLCALEIMAEEIQHEISNANPGWLWTGNTLGKRSETVPGEIA